MITRILGLVKRRSKWAGCGIIIVLLLCCGVTAGIGQALGIIRPSATKTPRPTKTNTSIPTATMVERLEEIPVNIVGPTETLKSSQTSNPTGTTRVLPTSRPTTTLQPAKATSIPTAIKTARPVKTATLKPAPRPTSTRVECCKHCGANSKPCGDSCISKKYTCHKPPGCACP